MFRVPTLLSALFVVAFLASCNNSGDGDKVKIEEVGRRTITQTVTGSGRIRPETEVSISSETSGAITFLGVQEGDSVKAGQLLVRINPDLVNTQLEQMEAAVAAAKARTEAAKALFERSTENVSRVNALFEKKYASKEELELANTESKQAESSYNASLKDYDRAVASLKQTKATAGRTAIYSPISGIVTRLNVEEGENVVGTAQMQGTEMMRVSDMSVMNTRIEVAETDIVLVSIGDTARIEVDAIPDTVFNGIVYQISNSAMTSAAGTLEEVVNFQVRIRLIDNDSRFRPGMSCSAEIETETQRDALSVPLQAVTVRRVEKAKDENSDEYGETTSIEVSASDERPPTIVFVAEDNKAVVREVETGVSDKGYIQITSGLSEGESVVTGSFRAISKELKDGSKIVVDSTQLRKGAE